MSYAVIVLTSIIDVEYIYRRRLCRMFEAVYLSVCLFVSETNDPKVFKLDIGNDFGIS